MESGAAGVPAEQTPGVGGQAKVVVTDDLGRSRLTVFFRLLLALPHVVFLALWTLVMVFVAFANWIAVIVSGRSIAIGLISRYLRYLTHVGAYANLGANPFPGFTGAPGSYPVDLEITEPGSQSRWSAAFRLVLAIPAVILAVVFTSASAWYVEGESGFSAGFSVGIIAGAALLGWFVSLARGRMAQGLRDLIAYGVGYVAQVGAYLLLLTDRYPDSDPLRPRYPAAAPGHQVRIGVADDLRRSRLTVFFRLLLALPHIVWVMLWGIVVLVAVFAQWFATLFAGRPAEPLHRFISAYVRYVTQMTAFLYLIANPFPSFTGQPGYPIDIRLPRPERQNRWKTGFRLVLSLPAWLISGVLSNALMLVAIFGWFVGVILGRMPKGLRNLGAFALRYNVQTWGYLALVTDRYPFAGPSLELLPEIKPATESAD